METTTEKPKEAVYITKIAYKETLRALPLNETTLFKTAEFKCSLARAAASTLKAKEGYEFTVCEDGMINEFTITKTKEPEKMP